MSKKWHLEVETFYEYKEVRNIIVEEADMIKYGLLVDGKLVNKAILELNDEIEYIEAEGPCDDFVPIPCTHYKEISRCAVDAAVQRCNLVEDENE